MDLQSLADLAEVVSAVTVVVSILYLAGQLKQNTRALRSVGYHSVVSNSVQLNSSIYGDPDFAALVVRAQADPDSLSPRDALRWRTFMLSAYRHWDDLYYQYRVGTLEEELWASYNTTLLSWLESRAWVEWFVANRSCFSAELQALVCAHVEAASAPGAPARRAPGVPA